MFKSNIVRNKHISRKNIFSVFIGSKIEKWITFLNNNEFSRNIIFSNLYNFSYISFQ